jgi:GTPase
MDIFTKPHKIKPAHHLGQEVEEGNHEYKFKLTNLTEGQITHRTSQLQWRLNEGNNVAIYHIGVEDSGKSLGLSEPEMNESLKNLQMIADLAGCDMCVRQLYAGEKGLTAEVVMTRRERLTVDNTHLTVTVAGDFDAGKSTLIGVLSSGQFDNGKGLARTRVFTHNHEIETGRTSSISHTVLHFDKDSHILNAEGNFGVKTNRLRALSDLELADETTRTVTLIDLAGHPKYLKTTVHGMLGRKPDYCMVCISVTAGIQPMTLEHIGIGLSLNVPLVFVFTKIDQLLASSGVSKGKRVLTQQQYSELKEHTKIKEILISVNEFFSQYFSQQENKSVTNQTRSFSFQFIDSNKELIDFLSPNTETGNIYNYHTLGRVSVPIFLTSNVTGDGLLTLKSLLYQLPDLNKVAGQLEIVQEEEAGKGSHCEELLVKNGNYIRILGSIGRIGSDDDEDEELEESDSTGDEMENDDSKIVSLQKQLMEIEKEIRGMKSIQSGDEEDSENDENEGTNTINVSEQNTETLEFSEDHSEEIAKYKKSLAELSLFVDLNPFATENNKLSNKTTSKKLKFPNKILIGKVISGKLQVMDELFFGPTLHGHFIPVVIASIRLNNVPVRFASAGQTATFKLVRVVNRKYDEFSPLIILKHEEKSTAQQIPLLQRSFLGADEKITNQTVSTTFDSPITVGQNNIKQRLASSGLVLMSSQLEPSSYYEFEAEMLIMNHPSKIRVNYEPVIHVGSVRQTGKIKEIRRIQSINNQEDEINSFSQDDVTTKGMDEVGNGEKALVRFKFLYNPEFIMVGETIIIREDRMKGIGKITRLFW